MYWANFLAAVGFRSVELAGGLYRGRRHVRVIEARQSADARIAHLALPAGRADVSGVSQ